VTNALSDVYYVRIITDAATTTAYTMNPFTITYINSGTTATAAGNTLKFITNKAVSPHAVSGPLAQDASSDTAAKKLVFKITSFSSSYTFYISVVV
jgi:CO dehydrogenase/acetyl-CoA synthase epsilon subunit